MAKFPARAPNTVFYVPNTDEGRAWIAQARAYLNRKHWKIRPRGRGPRKPYRGMGADQYGIRLDLAEYLGVKLWSPTRDDEIRVTLRELQARVRWLEGTLATTNQKAQADLELEKRVRNLMITFGKRKIRI